jgi:hypothetical protein
MYLTRQVDDDMLWNVAANDVDIEYDPLTLLRSRTSFGRPDWMSIYGRISQAIQTGQYIPRTDPRRKTRVGVSAFSFQCNAIHDSIFFWCDRRTSVALAPLPKPSEGQQCTTQVRLSSSPFPRFVIGTACSFFYNITLP